MLAESYPWQGCGALAKANHTESISDSSAKAQSQELEFLRPQFFRSIEVGVGHEWPSLIERIYHWSKLSPASLGICCWEPSGRDSRSLAKTEFTWHQIQERLESSQLEPSHIDSRPIVLVLANRALAPLQILEIWCAQRCLIPMSQAETQDRMVELLRSLPEDLVKLSSTAEHSWGIESLGFQNFELYRSNRRDGRDQLSIPRYDRQSDRGLKDSDSLAMSRWMNAVLTSGSTGFSKLVPQTRAQVFANAESLARRLELRAGDRLFTPLPLYHVNALNFALLTSILTGLEVHFSHALSPRSLLSAIGEARPRFVSLIPPLLRQLQSFSDDELRVAFRNTEAVISAATALSPELYDFVRDRLRIQLRQGYGLSECVNFSCMMKSADTDSGEFVVERELPDIGRQRLVSIGEALDGTEICIQDEQGRKLPVGQIGEICIRGYSAMNGYWSVSSQQQPFRDGWFQTGDLGFARVKPQGEITYFHAGRIKEVMKRSGETISLIEVDFKVNELLADPSAPVQRKTLEEAGARDFMAIGFSHEFTGEELGLVVQVGKLKSSAEFDPDEIRFIEAAWVKVLEQINPKLRPRAVLYVEDELRTASGKPQRWKFKSNFSPLRSQIMTLVPIQIWESGRPGAD